MHQQATSTNGHEQNVKVPAGSVELDGTLSVPRGARGIVVFVHGSGSSRLSPRNRYVADVIRRAGLATLLFDLLTPEEEEIDLRTANFRFDIDLLARRVIDATGWLTTRPQTANLNIGYFGASTGAAAALIAAAERPDDVSAIVSRGGRPDLAGPALPRVRAPTLLIVGERDVQVIELNRQAMTQMRGVVKLHIVPGATHLFEEPGALEEVARVATDWFSQYLSAGDVQQAVDEDELEHPHGSA